MKKLFLIFVASLILALPSAAQTDTKKPDAPAPTKTDTQKADSTDANELAARNAKLMDAYRRPTGNERLRSYLNSMFGPLAIARSIGTAGLSTWTNTPEEWGPTWEGFGRRFASNMGRNMMKNSMVYGLDEVMKVDSKFYRSKKRDVGSRVGNALISTVTARRPDGSRTVGVPRLFGTYASSVIASETWYPNRTWKDGLRVGTFSLGFNAGFNLVKEFVFK
jgi:hypothetical protein